MNRPYGPATSRSGMYSAAMYTRRMIRNTIIAAMLTGWLYLCNGLGCWLAVAVVAGVSETLYDAAHEARVALARRESRLAEQEHEAQFRERLHALELAFRGKLADMARRKP